MGNIHWSFHVAENVWLIYQWKIVINTCSDIKGLTGYIYIYIAPNSY